MTALDVLENKISSIKKYLKILEDYKGYQKDELKNDLLIKGSLERYLYLAVQSSIDLAEAVIAYKNFRKPVTIAENFQILQEEKIISRDLAVKLSKMVGFRNIIAHDYEEIDSDIVFDILKNKLPDIEEFLERCSQIK